MDTCSAAIPVKCATDGGEADDGEVDEAEDPPLQMLGNFGLDERRARDEDEGNADAVNEPQREHGWQRVQPEERHEGKSVPDEGPEQHAAARQFCGEAVDEQAAGDHAEGERALCGGISRRTEAEVQSHIERRADERRTHDEEIVHRRDQ